MAITHVANATGGNNGTSVSIAKADLSGLANNDIVVIAISQYEDVDVTWANADGFTIVDVLATLAGADMVSAFAYKVITSVAGEPATWDFANTYTSEKSAAASAFRGVDTTTPIGIAAASDSGTNDSTPPGRNITTTVANDMIVTGLHLASQNTTPILTGGAPVGFTLGGAVQFINNDYSASYLAYKINASPGTETIGDWTTTADSSPEWHVRSLSLKDATVIPLTRVLPMFSAMIG